VQVESVQQTETGGGALPYIARLCVLSSICAQPRFLASLILPPTTVPCVFYVKWLISATYFTFSRLHVLPRSFASGSLIEAAIKPSIEEHTYRVTVFDGICGGMDVRFLPLQETLSPKIPLNLHSHLSGQPVGESNSKKTSSVYVLNRKIIRSCFLNLLIDVSENPRKTYLQGPLISTL